MIDKGIFKASKEIVCATCRVCGKKFEYNKNRASISNINNCCCIECYK